MLSNELLTLPSSRITLSGFDADSVKENYPGLMRVKPSTYFGFDYRSIIRNLGLSKSEAEELFDRVYEVANLYFPGEPGRFYCHEMAAGDKQRCDIAFNDGKAEAPSRSGYIELEFVYSPVKLWREMSHIMLPKGRLRVGDADETHASCLFYYSIDALPDALRSLIDTQGDHIWLSPIEVEIYEIASRPQKVAFWDGHDGYRLSIQDVSLPSWEELSLSIGLAHKCKVLSYFRQAHDQHPDAIYFASHAKGLMYRKAKKMIDLGVQGTLRVTGNTIVCRIDSAELRSTFQFAYHAGLVPAKPRRSLSMDWPRKNTAHDAMYEMMLNGDASMLLEVDKKSYLKGVSHAR